MTSVRRQFESQIIDTQTGAVSNSYHQLEIKRLIEGSFGGQIELLNQPGDNESIVVRFTGDDAVYKYLRRHWQEKFHPYPLLPLEQYHLHKILHLIDPITFPLILSCRVSPWLIRNKWVYVPHIKNEYTPDLPRPSARSISQTIENNIKYNFGIEIKLDDRSQNFIFNQDERHIYIDNVDITNDQIKLLPKRIESYLHSLQSGGEIILAEKIKHHLQALIELEVVKRCYQLKIEPNQPKFMMLRGNMPIKGWERVKKYLSHLYAKSGFDSSDFASSQIDLLPHTVADQIRQEQPLSISLNADFFNLIYA